VNAQNSLKLVAALCFVSLGLLPMARRVQPMCLRPEGCSVNPGKGPLRPTAVEFEPIAARRRATCSGWPRGPQYTLYWPVLTRCCR